MGKIGKFLLLAVLGTQIAAAGGPQEVWSTFRRIVLRQAKSSPEIFLSPQLKAVHKGPHPFGVYTKFDPDREEVQISTLDTLGVQSTVRVNFLGYYPSVSSGLFFGAEKGHPLTPMQLQAMSRFSQYLLEEMLRKEKQMGGKGPFWREEMAHLGLWGAENLRNFPEVHWGIFGLKSGHLDSLMRLNDHYIHKHFEELNQPVPAIYHEFGYRHPQS